MQDLVRRAAAGDPLAFDALMSETSASVNTVVRSYVRDPEDARDVVQEVFLRALQRLGDLDDPERFRPWIYAIARNAGLDHVRRTRRRQVGSLDISSLLDPVDPDPSPEELAEVRDLAARVRVGMSRLTPRDATLLAMVTTLGFGPADVADTLGMSSTAAKVAIHRARGRLRNAVLLPAAIGATRVSGVSDGCERFVALLAADDLVAAAVHARACDTCGLRAQSSSARSRW